MFTTWQCFQTHLMNPVYSIISVHKATMALDVDSVQQTTAQQQKHFFLICLD